MKLKNNACFRKEIDIFYQDKSMSILYLKIKNERQKKVKYLVFVNLIKKKKFSLCRIILIY